MSRGSGFFFSREARGFLGSTMLSPSTSAWVAWGLCGQGPAWQCGGWAAPPSLPLAGVLGAQAKTPSPLYSPLLIPDRVMGARGLVHLGVSSASQAPGPGHLGEGGEEESMRPWVVWGVTIPGFLHTYVLLSETIVVSSVVWKRSLLFHLRLNLSCYMYAERGLESL